MTTFGFIPQTPALAEASPESLRELLEKDPRVLDEATLIRQVAALRAHREKLALAKAESKPRAQRKETKVAESGLKKATDASADELGF